jgi:anti-sigma factor RsiW
MNAEDQLKLQSFLDGELPEPEAREVAAWLARDAEARALHTELRNTRQAFKNSEAAVQLPETREFYWAKIRREIERLEPEARTVETPALFRLLRRFLMPAGTVAGLALVAVFLGLQFGMLGSKVGPETESATADSGAFTYKDESSGTTLVWVSFPAETRFASGTMN